MASSPKSLTTFTELCEYLREWGYTTDETPWTQPTYRFFCWDLVEDRPGLITPICLQAPRLRSGANQEPAWDSEWLEQVLKPYLFPSEPGLWHFGPRLPTKKKEGDPDDCK